MIDETSPGTIRIRDIPDTNNNTNISPNAKLGLIYDPEKRRDEVRKLIYNSLFFSKIFFLRKYEESSGRDWISQLD